ncbi:MAG: GNAT family N-acetyltransferase [Candidatus Lokiarchaeota archaeon]|nr:GNAT family N-acetyltransferase [Candidatus Lokiarchaeota archaeon]
MRKFEYVQHFETKKGNKFLLRPASLDDANIIQENIQTVCDERIFLYTDSFLMTKEWENVLADPVNEEKGLLLILAEVDKMVVGHLRLFPPWYGRKGRHVGEVGLSIIQQWRGHGIGAAMITYTLKWAKHIGEYQKTTASVFSINIRALNLFFKFGFFEEGRRKKQILINQDYIDEILLGRFLK